jgi:hypothetical protein
LDVSFSLYTTLIRSVGIGLPKEELQPLTTQPRDDRLRRIETSGHEQGVVGTLLVADDDLRLADSRLSGRIHEVSEQMSRLGLLVASSDPPGQ